VQLDFKGTPPKIKVPGMLSCRKNANTMIITTVDKDLAHLRKFEESGEAKMRVNALGFEEIFIELVK